MQLVAPYVKYTIVVTAPPVCACTSNNMVVNGDMAAGNPPSTWTAPQGGWSQGTGSSTGLFGVLNNSDVNTDFFVYQDQVAVAGKTYTFNALASTHATSNANPASEMYLEFYNGTTLVGTSAKSSTTVVYNGTLQALSTIVMTAPAGTTTVRIVGHSKGRALKFDNVTLTTCYNAVALALGTKADPACSQSNGSVTVTASGGSGTYEYSKDNFVTKQTSNVFNGLVAGTYTFYVRDVNASTCKATLPITLTCVNTCTISAAVSQVSCHNNGTLSTGTDDYVTFLLTPTGTTGERFTLTATQGGSPVTVTLSDGSATGNLSYAYPTPLRLPVGAAGKGNIVLTLKDVNNTSCTKTVTVTDPGVCTVGVCTSAPQTVTYTYRTPLKSTELNQVPLNVPKFDNASGTRTLSKVDLQYGISEVTNAIVENTAASSSTLTLSITGSETLNLGATVLKTQPISYTATKTLPTGIVVSAQGSYLGDSLYSAGRYSTLYGMDKASKWLGNYMDDMYFNPTTDSRWVTNATGVLTSDDDIYVMPVQSFDVTGTNSYITATDLAQFIGTGNLPLTASTVNNVNFQETAGNNIFSQRTKAYAYVTVTYTYNCCPVWTNGNNVTVCAGDKTIPSTLSFTTTTGYKDYVEWCVFSQPLTGTQNPYDNTANKLGCLTPEANYTGTASGTTISLSNFTAVDANGNSLFANATGSPITMYIYACIKSSDPNTQSCRTFATHIVTVNPKPATPVINTQTTTVCPGQTISLSVSNCTGGLNWTWGSSSSAGTSIIVSPTVTTTYTATCTLNGCISSATKTITVGGNCTPTGDPICLSSTRDITDNLLCGSTTMYGMWLNDLVSATQTDYKWFSIKSGTITEYCDGTALLNYTACAVGGGANDCITVDVKMSGRTANHAPYGNTHCDVYNPTKTNEWYYYTTVVSGTLAGKSGGIYNGFAANYTQKDANFPFQMGEGANLNELTQMGASGWFTISITNGGTNSWSSVSRHGDNNFRVGSLTPIAKVTATANPTAICAGGNVTLTATLDAASKSAACTPVSYSWVGSNGFIGTGASITNTNVVNTTTSPITVIYTVTVTIKAINGSTCSVVGTTSVTVNPNPTVTVDSKSVCLGGTATLTASGCIGTVVWSGSGTGNGTTITVTPSAVGSYTYTATCTNTNNCKATASGVVTVIAKPTVSLPADMEVCSGTSTQLTATGCTGGTLVWSANVGGSTSATVTVIPTNTGTSPTTITYSVTCTTSTNNGCTATDAVIVTVNPLPTVTLSPTNITCNGAKDGKILATGNVGTPLYTFSINGGAFTTPAAASNTFTGLDPNTTYTITVKDSKGCIATSSATLTQPAVLAVTTTKVDPKCEKSDGSINLSVTGGTTPYTYLWSDGSTTEDLTAKAEGTYSVTVTDQKGCKATTTVALTPQDCSFDLALKKVLKTAGTYKPGDNATFTISVINQGTVTATNVQVTDYIPTGLTLADATWTATAGKATLNTVIATLAPGATVTKDITFTINSNYEGASVVNRAEISAATNARGLTDKDSNPNAILGDDKGGQVSSPADDYVDGNGTGAIGDGVAATDEDDEDPALLNITQTFDLALIKKVKAGQATTFNQGDNVNFVIEVKNQGTLTAQTATVTDYIPTGMSFVASTGWTSTASTATNNTITNLAPGATATLNLTLKVDANYEGEKLVNRAEISAATNLLNIADKDSKPDTDGTNDAGGKVDDLTDFTDNANNNGDGTGTVNGIDPAKDEDDSDPASIAVNQFFDLALTKALQTPTEFVKPGDNVTFVITVKNQGTLDATNVKISDYIPTGMSLNDANWTGTPAQRTLAGTIAKNGGIATTTITLKVDNTSAVQNQTLVNRAEITSATNSLNKADKDSKPDAIVGNDAGGKVDDLTDNVIDGDGTGLVNGNDPAKDEDDEDPASVKIQSYDLALVKVLKSTGTIAPGSDVTFTIKVKNQGSIPATNIKITDYIPSDMTLNDATWTLAGNLATNNSVIATLAAGEEKTIDITLKVKPTFEGTKIVNRAEISSTGDKNENGTDIKDIDSTPDQTSTNDAGGKEETATDFTDNTNNNGNGTGTPNGTDPATDEDDADPAIVTVTQTFDLALIKKLAATQATPVKQGDNVSYVIEVKNQGTLTAQTATVTDYIPAGMSFVTSSGWTSTASTATNNTITNLAPGATATLNLTLKVDANYEGEKLVNRAEISAATNALGQADKDSKPDTDATNDAGGKEDDLTDFTDNANNNGNGTGAIPSNNPVTDEDDSDPASIAVKQEFDLALTKVLAPGQAASVKPGDDVKFLVTVSNQGSLNATNVQVSDYIPTGMTFNAAKNTGWTATGSTATYAIAGTIPRLTGTATAIITLTVDNTSAVQGTDLVNRAEISAAQNSLGKLDKDSKADATKGNDAGGLVDSPADNEVNGNGTGVAGDGIATTDEDDEDPAKVTILKYDLALVKKLTNPTTPIRAGDNVSFTFTVTNQGSIPAKGVEVTDYLPTGLTFNAASNPTWSTVGTSQVKTTIAGPIAPNETASVTIILKVDASKAIQGTSIVNRAEISATADKNDNGTAIKDIDSTPNTTSTDDAGGKEGTASDDSIGGNGTGNPGDTNAATDEDDADPALINIEKYDLALTKKLQDATKQVKAGDNVPFVITVKNQGTIPANGVEITDYIPTGFSFVAGSNPTWTSVSATSAKNNNSNNHCCQWWNSNGSNYIASCFNN